MSWAAVVAEPGLAWIAGGLVLLVLEALTPGFFLVWLGVAAIGTGMLTHVLLLDFGLEAGVFAVLAAAAIGVGLRLRRRPPTIALNTATSGLIGRTAIAVRFDGGEGRVRLGDSEWPARLAWGAGAPAASARLEVTGVDGTVLIVREREPAHQA